MTYLTTLDLRHTVEPVKSDRWKNLIFSKSGTSFIGLVIWPSEKAARNAIKQALDDLASGTGQSVPTLSFSQNDHPGLETFIDTDDNHIWYGLRLSDYSHTIQIPWSGDL